MRRSTIITLVILTLLVVVAVVGIGLKPDSTPRSPMSNTDTAIPPTPSTSSNNYPPASPTAPKPAAGKITIDNNIFSPPQISIQKGSAVTWTNNDNVAHTVTIDQGEGPMSGDIVPGGTYSYTFNKAGSFQYHCEIHHSMRGTIVVK